MNYLFELVDLLNKYDEKNEKEINRIRDLICYISDNSEYMNNPLYRSIIFDAAQKIRMFGYIKGSNKISQDEFLNDDVNDIKYKAVENYYKSKIYSNNLLDKKQKEIIDIFDSLVNRRILVSAPTSFGKTFILREIIFSNRYNYKNILLIFPTIALLNENSMNLNKIISDLKLNYKVVNNVYSEINDSDKHIIILTPERTLKLMADNEKLQIDFFFFDEVYKIDEDYAISEDGKKSKGDNRAKAFRIVLYLLSKKVNDYYIAGPYLNLDNIRKGMQRYIDINNITIKQIDFEPTSKIEIDAWNKECIEHHPIFGEKNTIIYNSRPHNATEKVINIIKFLKNNNLGQAIFYCSAPTKSMEYVRKIIPEIHDEKKNIPLDFIEHLRNKYNVIINDRNSVQYWTLIKALEKGIGIHHGKFPKYIQNEVLRLFNEGIFDYLFCTSTIIEGVNTNAKNVIIVNNSVGSTTMTAFSLKNIKGRAGRYYHHTMGRIIYTDQKQRQIECEDDIMLDFQTYDDKKILDVDIDNAEIIDLSNQNKMIKNERENSYNKDILPDNVFCKNRLYERNVQEKYLKYIMKSEVFSMFIGAIENSSNIYYFLNNRIINSIIDTLKEVEILDENKAKVYSAIINNYSINRTKGVLKYHLNRLDFSTEDSIDKAYIKAFEQIRNIVEYEIPKLLCLFEALYNQAGILLGYNMDSFNLSAIIRFFELGVISELGLFLVEYGFPVDTIVEMENKQYNLKKMSKEEAADYLLKNNKIMDNVFDSYEKQLFLRSVKGFVK